MTPRQLREAANGPWEARCSHWHKTMEWSPRGDGTAIYTYSCYDCGFASVHITADPFPVIQHDGRLP